MKKMEKTFIISVAKKNGELLGIFAQKGKTKQGALSKFHTGKIFKAYLKEKGLSRYDVRHGITEHGE